MVQQLSLCPLTEEQARELSTWQYEPPYAIYSFGSWEKAVAVGESLTDPERREADWRGVVDGRGEVVGFVEFMAREVGVRLGLGLRPDHCGRGLGGAVMSLIIAEARRRCPTGEIDLEVLVWNRRAATVYERVGFQVVEEYDRPTPTGTGRFYRMVYRPHL